MFVYIILSTPFKSSKGLCNSYLANFIKICSTRKSIENPNKSEMSISIQNFINLEKELESAKTDLKDLNENIKRIYGKQDNFGFVLKIFTTLTKIYRKLIFLVIRSALAVLSTPHKSEMTRRKTATSIHHSPSGDPTLSTIRFSADWE